LSYVEANRLGHVLVNVYEFETIFKYETIRYLKQRHLLYKRVEKYVWTNGCGIEDVIVEENVGHGPKVVYLLFVEILVRTHFFCDSSFVQVKVKVDIVKVEAIVA
jgi:hypothetical protein